MIMILSYSGFSLNWLRSRWLIVSILVGIELFLGLVPNWSGHFAKLEFNSLVYAVDSITDQQITDQQINSYAKAILQIEHFRQEAYNTIKKKIGSDIPETFCTTASLNQLTTTDDVRNTAKNFCNQSTNIIKSNGLSVEQFNQITAAMATNSDLKQKINNALLNLQQHP